MMAARAVIRDGERWSRVALLSMPGGVAWTTTRWGGRRTTPPVGCWTRRAPTSLKRRSRRFTALCFAVRGGHVNAASNAAGRRRRRERTDADGMECAVLALYNAHFGSRRFCSIAVPIRTRREGWTALHQVAWSRRPNRGFNIPGVPTRDR